MNTTERPQPQQPIETRVVQPSDLVTHQSNAVTLSSVALAQATLSNQSPPQTVQPNSPAAGKK